MSVPASTSILSQSVNVVSLDTEETCVLKNATVEIMGDAMTFLMLRLCVSATGRMQENIVQRAAVKMEACARILHILILALGANVKVSLLPKQDVYIARKDIIEYTASIQLLTTYVNHVQEEQIHPATTMASVIRAEAANISIRGPA